MATSYEGPATLRVGALEYSVRARLSTTVGAAYSWQGTASTTDITALDLQGHGGALTLPGRPAGEVHVAVTELHPGGGVLLRLHGVGRAPYEEDGDIIATRTEDGATVYATMDAVTQPSLGDNTPPPGGQCSYETPAGGTCGAPATWHGLVYEPDSSGVEGMEACADHLPVMSGVAKWIHPWTDACGTGAGFDPAANRCVDRH